MAGVRARRRCGGRSAGIRAGAITGFTVGLLITSVYLMVDNTLVTIAEHWNDWFPALPSQPMRAWRTTWELHASTFADRRLWHQGVDADTRLRTLINVQELRAGVITIPVYTLAGVLLPLPGAVFGRPTPQLRS